MKSFISAHFQTIRENVTLAVPLGLDTRTVLLIETEVLAKNMDSEVGKESQVKHKLERAQPLAVTKALALERYWCRS